MQHVTLHTNWCRKEGELLCSYYNFLTVLFIESEFRSKPQHHLAPTHYDTASSIETFKNQETHSKSVTLLIWILFIYSENTAEKSSIRKISFVSASDTRLFALLPMYVTFHTLQFAYLSTEIND